MHDTLVCFEPTFTFMGFLYFRYYVRPPNAQWKTEERLRSPTWLRLGVKITRTGILGNYKRYGQPFGCLFSFPIKTGLFS